MSGFKKAVEHILLEEGGYSFDPRDPGGETKYGISKRAYPKEDVKNLTVEQAKELYRRDYWNPIKGDDLPPSIALITFDAAVNQGVSKASKWLQKAVGVEQDGKVGPATVAAAKASSSSLMVQEIATYRLRHYLGMDNNTEEVYEKGWIARLLRTVIRAIEAKEVR